MTVLVPMRREYSISLRVLSSIFSYLAFYFLHTILILDKLCQGSTLIPFLVHFYPSIRLKLSRAVLDVHVKITMILDSRII
jgi:hypothetical protein